jgi:hypothetical protein
MAKHLPTRPSPARAVHYIDVAPHTGEVTLVTRAELAARQAEQREMYARWRARQDAIAEHDRKVRRFLLGFGAAIGTGVLAGIGIAGWLVYHAITTAGAGLIAVPLVVLAVVGLAAGGQRCITIIQHWH